MANTMEWHRDLSRGRGDRAWRIAILFMVGSALFALGSFPPYSQLVDGVIVGATFVIGSLVFTVASYTAFVDTINADDGDETGSTRWWAWQFGSRAWWAAFVQLIGTLLFNASTIDAMSDSLTTEEENRLVWAPDFFGATMFLIASHLAWTIVCNGIWCVRRDDSAWWSAMLNYLGSILFMASAIAAFTLPTTGETLNITIVNVATFVGAACFLLGSYLILPPAGSSVTR
jgi:hypothetical protein